MRSSVPRSQRRLRNAEPAHQPAAAAPAASAARRFAVIGAGMAGVACARTLVQAGHEVVVFEKSARPGGRTGTLESPFGGFDTGAQYFTVRDPRFQKALDTVPGLCRAWSANTVRVLDAAGRVAAAAPPPGEAHWVATPGMDALVAAWAQPLQQAGRLLTGTHATRIEADPLRPGGWQVRTGALDGSVQVHAGFDAVLLSQPAPAATALLQASGIELPEGPKLEAVTIAPCWTLMHK